MRAGYCRRVPLTVLTLKELEVLIPPVLSRELVQLPGYLLASLYPVQTPQSQGRLGWVTGPVRSVT